MIRTLRTRFVFLIILGLSCTALLLALGCQESSDTGEDGASSSEASEEEPDDTAHDDGEALPDEAYYLQPDLPAWVDEESGYDTAKEWELDGGEWPATIVLSPSQSPQLLAGMEAGIYQDALEPHDVTPVLTKLDGPPRVFHALERSQWPFVYMPMAVFTDYARSPDNQGGAGGLQYVALAGSTAGGGYTLMARPGVESLEDLKGRSVACLNTNPVPGTLLEKAAEQQGITLGAGPDEIEVVHGPTSDQLNAYAEGEYDAIVVFNILRKQLEEAGSQAVTDFSDVEYVPNYTILAVERTVLEERPEVVDAFLEAHYESQQLAEAQWDTTMPQTLFDSWNSFFENDQTSWASQRIVPDVAAYEAMLGDMWPEQRIDPELMQDCFDYNTTNDNWGWDGTVDEERLTDYSRYDAVLEANGEDPQ